MRTWLPVLAGCLAVLLLAASTGPALAQPHPPSGPTPTVLDDPALFGRYQQMISADELAAHVYYLASDLLEGRGTGQPGQRLAAHYLAAQYRQVGAAPKGTVTTADPYAPEAYFQPFEVYSLSDPATQLDVLRGDQTVWTGYFPTAGPDGLFAFHFGNAVGATGGVVFGGYGIADPELGYDDYAALEDAGLRLDGKWLLILRDEPLANDSTSLLPTSDGKPSRWTTHIGAKRVALYEQRLGRPAGVLIVDDVGPRAAAFSAAVAPGNRGPLGLETPSPEAEQELPPIYLVSHQLADLLLASSGRTVAQLRQAIDRQRTPVVFELPETTLRTTVEPASPLETENVLAFIEGSDPALRSEVIVVTSHYDHLGINPSLPGDQIFNGAADDASGTAATLALARAFARARDEGFGPRRSLLFINFTAEERGVVGSHYYTSREPVVPMAAVAANINMDGIGGTDADNPTGSPDYLYLVGSRVVPSLSTELHDLAHRLNEATGIGLKLAEGDDWGSDQIHFERAHVPFLYFSTGLTEHYHQPSDEPSTIDYTHMTRAVQLVFATVWQAANQEAAPVRPALGALPVTGYLCPPCPVGCDHLVFDHPGRCPICRMVLVPRHP